MYRRSHRDVTSAYPDDKPTSLQREPSADKMNSFPDVRSVAPPRSTSFFIEDILLKKPQPVSYASPAQRDLQVAVSAAAVAAAAAAGLGGPGSSLPRVPAPVAALPPDYAGLAAYLPGSAAAAAMAAAAQGLLPGQSAGLLTHHPAFLAKPMEHPFLMPSHHGKSRRGKHEQSVLYHVLYNRSYSSYYRLHSSVLLHYVHAVFRDHMIILLYI